MFIKIDDWLFDKAFQPIADWVFDTTGKNTFWLAGTMCWLLLLLGILLLVLYPREETAPLLHTVIDNVYLVFVGLLCVSEAVQFDKKAKINRQTNRNVARILPKCIRMRKGSLILLAFYASAIFWYGPLSRMLITTSFFVVFTSIQYFMACDTKPPSPPKKSTDLQSAYAT